MKKKLFFILLIGILTFGLTGCRYNQRIVDRVKDYWDDELNGYDKDDDYDDEDDDYEDYEKYGLGETFTFDSLKITFDKYYTFTKVDDEYSEHDGDLVIKIGATIKNISSNPHKLNMFYYELYGSNDDELDDVNTYFDDTVDYANNLNPGETYKKYFYILYDGSGKYKIEFDNLNDEILVQFIVKK